MAAAASSAVSAASAQADWQTDPMPTYVVLLRAVNLAKRNKVPMAGLREGLAARGYDGTKTYLLSGNAVLRSNRGEPRVAKDVEDVIRTDFGVATTALVRPLDELTDLLTANPFSTPHPVKTNVMVTFLSEPPDPAAVSGLDPGSFEPEEFEVHGRAVFLRFPGTALELRLNNSTWEAKLGLRATTRTLRTVSGLHRMAASLPS
jgi:uncharacterized protein (DUF1697 family)